MKSTTFIGCALLTGALAIGLTSAPSQGQAGGEDPQLTALVDEVAKQQAAIVDNQAKIDEKLAVIAEDVRVARIFVGRGGGKTK